MPFDLFQFWSGVGPADKVHPADRDVLSRVKHGFNLECLPACVSGPLKTAPVVLLYLSPGLNEPEDLEMAHSEAGQSWYVRRRSGSEPLPGPEIHKPAWRWWSSRTRCFGDWQQLKEKVAVLNIGAYHSRTFVDAPLLAALPSSRASLDWGQEVLFPQAIAGDRAVICLRASRFWGLNEGRHYKASLYAPKVTRSGHMVHNDMRDAIIRDVRERLGIGRT